MLHDALLAPGGRCSGYRLVVTGHSLGAGCAFLLALYLRQFCPNLKSVVLGAIVVAGAALVCALVSLVLVYGYNSSMRQVCGQSHLCHPALPCCLPRSLRCWAFSPPGGLASREVCASAVDWCHRCDCAAAA